jgi:hypothetical protein
MLEWQIAHRQGERLSAEKRERFVAELARLREASVALQHLPGEPQTSEDLRDRLTQTLALMQVDRAFRDELGMGVADFVRGLNPHAVEDVSPAPPDP